eukprot:gene17117-biopygen12854
MSSTVSRIIRRLLGASGVGEVVGSSGASQRICWCQHLGCVHARGPAFVPRSKLTMLATKLPFGADDARACTTPTPVRQLQQFVGTNSSSAPCGVQWAGEVVSGAIPRHLRRRSVISPVLLASIPPPKIVQEEEGWRTRGGAATC